MSAPARVLAIGGSDPSGGAGIQADIKTIMALGGYGMGVITAITVQNTKGVQAVHMLPPELVRDQIRTVLDDIGADAIKIGMLGDAFIVAAVADAVQGASVPIVLDPLWRASSGAALLDDNGLRAMRTRLFPLARLLTPNLPEAERLSGLGVATMEERRAAAASLLATGPQAVLLKGGHGEGDKAVDLLLWAKGEAVFESPRLASRHTHGTGCALASATATLLAQGCALTDAVRLARRYVRGAIQHAPGFGAGHGPLAHNWRGPEV